MHAAIGATAVAAVAVAAATFSPSVPTPVSAATLPTAAVAASLATASLSASLASAFSTPTVAAASLAAAAATLPTVGAVRGRGVGSGGVAVAVRRDVGRVASPRTRPRSRCSSRHMAAHTLRPPCCSASVRLCAAPAPAAHSAPPTSSCV